MYEIATFGQGTEMQFEETYKVYKPSGVEEKTLTTWPGKQAMLGSSWYGVKNLNGGW